MTVADKVFVAFCVVVVPPFIAIGGLFHPNTLAGAFARLVFSLQ